MTLIDIGDASNQFGSYSFTLVLTKISSTFTNPTHALLRTLYEQAYNSKANFASRPQIQMHTSVYPLMAALITGITHPYPTAPVSVSHGGQVGHQSTKSRAPHNLAYTPHVQHSSSQLMHRQDDLQ
jgi:hypothetical protein